MAQQMKLKSFRVKLFRNIIDSGEILVDDVTCLVGKNEAGKSAVLQALHQLNPAKPEVTLDLLDEYPRWLKKQHEITGEIEAAEPIRATFEISDALAQQITDRFGMGTLESQEVQFYRTYKEPHALKAQLSLDYSAVISPFLENVPDRLRKAIGDVRTTSELIAKLDQVIESGTVDDASDKAAALGDDAEDAKAKLSDLFGGKSSLSAAVEQTLKEHLPRTFYFSTYSQLEGRYYLDEVFAAVANGSADESLQAAADFLQLARAVPDTVEDWNFEKSNAELESISSLLTTRVKELWKQNDHLKLRVNLETQATTQPDGRERAERYLQFRVEDTRHDFSSRLDRRSTGFRWFISFIASFLEFEMDQNLILILDEPGLSLHARAQMDLLNTIESKLANERQVLYSTHSPFMVKTSQLSRVRITEDQGPVTGSVVTNDAGVVSDPDTLFPLQAALGYDIVQSIFVGNQNVLLEGVSDFIYLTAISDHLESTGRAHLATTTRLLPAGGATNVPTFIALLGTKLDIVVVIDGNSDRQKIEDSIAKGRLDAARVLTLDSFSTVKKADIEDLFTAAEYLGLYNGAFNKSLKLSDLIGKDRIVNRIERKEGEFNHRVVAAYFLRNLDKSLKSLSTDTLNRFESLIQAINCALPPT
jgi:predicted ATP-dependent endonuclease of OLD family